MNCSLQDLLAAAARLAHFCERPRESEDLRVAAMRVQRVKVRAMSLKQFCELYGLPTDELKTEREA